MFVQTALELLKKLRQEIDDLAPDGDALQDSDRLWKNDELYSYLDEGHAEWARITRALLTEVSIPVVIAEPLVTVPAWVQDILEARLSTARSPVHQYNRNESGFPTDDYGAGYSNFDDYSVGTPRFFTGDYVSKKLRLTPIPVATDTLVLRVVALPKVSFSTGAAPSSTDLRDIRCILNWAKYRAYDKQDMETLDKAQSDRFRRQFEEEVMLREQEINRLRRRAGVVRYGGI